MNETVKMQSLAESYDTSKVLEDHEERIARIEAQLAVPAQTLMRKSTSVREYLLGLNLQSEVDRVVALGHYFESHRDRQSFGIADLTAGYGEAKEPLPKNLNDATYKAVQRGYLMEAETSDGSRKAWTLTNKGIERVESLQKQGGPEK